MRRERGGMRRERGGVRRERGGLWRNRGGLRRDRGGLRSTRKITSALKFKIEIYPEICKRGALNYGHILSSLG
ncbi:hypothetical protein ACF0H5_004600 [Mactra antiquata]